MAVAVWLLAERTFAMGVNPAVAWHNRHCKIHEHTGNTNTASGTGQFCDSVSCRTFYLIFWLRAQGQQQNAPFRFALPRSLLHCTILVPRTPYSVHSLPL